MILAFLYGNPEFMRDSASSFSVLPPLPDRTLVLVGMMGAGKSSIGRRLAQRLGLPFTDADTEIEAAAGCTIPEIFAGYGEAEFRRGERRVIARLLEQPRHILATGGGAFMDESTRALILDKAIAVWLKADLDTLVARTARRQDRPLLRNGDPRVILGELLIKREPVYALAPVIVSSDDRPPEETVDMVLNAVNAYERAQQEHVR